MGRTLVRQTSFAADGQDYAVVCMEDAEPPLPVALGRLTPSEREVVALVAEGLRSQEIAVKRRRSVRTIENQLAAIFKKLEVGSRAELSARLSGST
jgi:DNA-binding NarL/FixJ family response regulator